MTIVNTNEEELVYEFGPFRLKPTERILLRNGQAVSVPPKVFDTLSLLVRKCGSVVRKNELIEAIWPNSFVADASLSQNIFIIRKVIAEGRDASIRLDTVSRVGYRFVADIAVSRVETNSLAENIATDAPNDVLTLAVLPFANFSSQPDAECLADGIAENIINNLSLFSPIGVMAWSTVLRYKQLSVDLREVGRELNVKTILIGKLLSLNDALILRVELVNVANGWQLWGEQYGCQPSDILSTQEKLAKAITEMVRLRLGIAKESRRNNNHAGNTEASQLYAKGRFYSNKFTRDGLMKSIELFNQAINIDSNYAPAYAGLSDSYYNLSDLYMSPLEAMPKSKAAALKAVELDESLAEAHTALGTVHMFYDWDWKEAERSFKQAIEINPYNALAHSRYANFLAKREHSDKAVEEISLAQELDPLGLEIRVRFGTILCNIGDYDRAIITLQRAIEIDPTFFVAHAWLGKAFGHVCKLPEAIEKIYTAISLNKNHQALRHLGYIYAQQGCRNEAMQVINEMIKLSKRSYLSPFSVAVIYSGLNEKERALQWLEKAQAERNEFLSGILTDVYFANLQEEPRFINLLKRVRLR